MRTRFSEKMARSLLLELAKVEFEESERPAQVIKIGTSAGAYLGWETRRAGGKVEVTPEHAFLSSVKDRIGSIADEEAADINQAIEDHRKGLPSDYAGMARRDRERRERGYRVLTEAVAKLKEIRPRDEKDAAILGELLEYADKEAQKATMMQSEIAWDETFDQLLRAAMEVTQRSVEKPESANSLRNGHANVKE